MSFQLPELPYAKDALEPHISKETLEYHHDKHHATYVTKLNGLVKGTEYETKTIEEIITSKPATGIFNNAAQAYNHDFYWKCMAPNGVKPSEKMLQKINEAFGSFEEFKKQFTAKAVGHFGSGWCWLVLNNGKLEIQDFHDAQTPIANGLKPLLCCDVWEHAYYIDTRNNRAAYF